MIQGFLVGAALRQFTRPQRVVGWLILIAALFGIALLFRFVNGEMSRADAYNQLSSLLVYRLLMLAAALFSTAVLTQEIDQKTIVYWVTRPVPRSSLILSRMLAAAIASAVLTTLAGLTVSLAVYQEQFLSNEFFWRDLKAFAMGSVAYIVLFTLFSLWINRAMIVDLLFAFGWESMVANMAGNIYNISIFSYLKAIAEKPNSGSPGALGALAGERSIEYIAASTGWIVLGVFVVVGSWLAAWWFSTHSYLPREDAE